jgi:hypothetical protein
MGPVLYRLDTVDDVEELIAEKAFSSSFADVAAIDVAPARRVVAAIMEAIGGFHFSSELPNEGPVLANDDDVCTKRNCCTERRMFGCLESFAQSIIGIINLKQ